MYASEIPLESLTTHFDNSFQQWERVSKTLIEELYGVVEYLWGFV